MRPVVITRPAAQASAFVARLNESACTAHLFPLLDIQPLEDTTLLQARLGNLSDYALVVFVSPNAIDAAFAHINSWPPEVIAAVVGEGSRLALARHGVTDKNATIVSPRDKHQTDSETLLMELDLNALRGKNVLIVRAETGRELLADQLRSAGIEVEQIAAYRRLAPVFDADKQAALIKLISERNDWVITSSEGLRLLQDMLEQSAIEDGWLKMCEKSLIVPHKRIEQTARSLGFRHIILCGSGDEAIYAAIQSRT